MSIFVMRPLSKPKFTAISLSLSALLILTSCSFNQESSAKVELPKSTVKIEELSTNSPSLGNSLDEEPPIVFSLDNPYLPDTINPIKGFIDDVGFTEIAEKIYMESNPEYVSATVLNSACSAANTSGDSNILGCFTTAPQKIYLYDITDDRVAAAEPIIAAHELLHAIWFFDMNQKERDRITILLENYFDSLPREHYLRGRLKSYADTPKSIPTELHSILGSEADYLPAELESHYLKYFKSRDTLIALTNVSFRYIYKLDIENKELGELISAQRLPLEMQRMEIDNESDQLDEDIRNFNKSVEDGTYKNDQETYLAAKGPLDGRRIELNELSGKFKEQTIILNDLILEYNASILLYNDLNKGIQSR